MAVEADVKFWDSSAESYSRRKVSDQAAYERTLDRTRSFLKPADTVLELGCGTGTTALRLADNVRGYLATDISPEMIKIANEKHAAANAQIIGLSFRAAAAEELAAEPARFNVVLGFNYLHLVQDLPSTLRAIHSTLEDGGLFISKTGCLGDMNPLLARVALPVLHFVGKAPHTVTFRAPELSEQIQKAGFEILKIEKHGSRGNDTRPYIVARKVGGNVECLKQSQRSAQTDRHGSR